ncbi:23S rRNA (cytidine1920-2'-O)/16S rRNA (cytidine1409-2'-O)-methyltransferase [Salsuginibacillus halophilus]|uniref:23S rRNA (Cytidine1920-2'-O)/16S rRNA (Cytidine1409-2'-O)-methyltransferase n=1 Tax=Salsuginibacillus halophilus TaxID=517424 RepID=A0A2P8HAF1_9BACI|nr:TlyA family RNA methyltransferase [Salsuginibacillus halophilus]PSL43203.1 23S rRNA (cytidine1920-2'-O)/16S rRNA (cytidine1409-2'-O)-methyltransferase [Salsuginibacillus halophilus]
MSKKERADVLAVEQGLADTREKAKRSIMAGLLYAETERIDKPGTKLDSATPLRMKGELLPYVSRGGLKLEKALQAFAIDLNEKTVLDIGASTGGFTDCALQHGAANVYAVDVGYNQLAWKLRTDERVTSLERVNFRYMTEDDLPDPPPEAAVCDVSFISLSLILPPLKKLLTAGGDAVVLVKPQFEAGRDEVGKKGIVREAHIHERVLHERHADAEANGFQVIAAARSPITGTGGNVEYLFHLKRVSGQPSPITVEDLTNLAYTEACDD